MYTSWGQVAAAQSTRGGALIYMVRPIRSTPTHERCRRNGNNKVFAK